MTAIEIVQALAGLVRAELSMPESHVVIANQRWNIPADDALYAVVSLTGFRVYGGDRQYINRAAEGDVPGALIEKLSHNRSEIYTVDVFSSDPAKALEAQEQLPFVFRSQRAEQLQKTMQAKFGQLPLSAVDASAGEASRRLSRYVYTFQLLRTITRERVVQYMTPNASSPALTIEP